MSSFERRKAGEGGHWGRQWLSRMTQRDVGSLGKMKLGEKVMATGQCWPRRELSHHCLDIEVPAEGLHSAPHQ